MHIKSSCKIGRLPADEVVLEEPAVRAIVPVQDTGSAHTKSKDITLKGHYVIPLICKQATCLPTEIRSSEAVQIFSRAGWESLESTPRNQGRKSGLKTTQCNLLLSISVW
jgi:hypothetical protein